MVTVTRLDGHVVILNADLIETIEEVPDTVISLINHKRVIVREPVSLIIERIIAYQRAVRTPLEEPRSLEHLSGNFVDSRGEQ